MPDEATFDLCGHEMPMIVLLHCDKGAVCRHVAMTIEGDMDERAMAAWRASKASISATSTEPMNA